MITPKRMTKLQVKRKAAIAERIIRRRESNAAMRRLTRVEKLIGELNAKIAQLEGAQQ